MEPGLLQQHIRELATLPESDAPVISCYLALSKGSLKDRNSFDHQLRRLERGLAGARRQDLADAAHAQIAVVCVPDDQITVQIVRRYGL